MHRKFVVEANDFDLNNSEIGKQIWSLIEAEGCRGVDNYFLVSFQDFKNDGVLDRYQELYDYVRTVTNDDLILIHY